MRDLLMYACGDIHAFASQKAGRQKIDDGTSTLMHVVITVAPWLKSLTVWLALFR